MMMMMMMMMITNDNIEHFFRYLYWLVSQNVYWTCCSNLNEQNKKKDNLNRRTLSTTLLTLTNKC